MTERQLEYLIAAVFLLCFVPAILSLLGVW